MVGGKAHGLVAIPVSRIGQYGFIPSARALRELVHDAAAGAHTEGRIASQHGTPKNISRRVQEDWTGGVPAIGAAGKAVQNGLRPAVRSRQFKDGATTDAAAGDGCAVKISRRVHERKSIARDCLSQADLLKQAATTDRWMEIDLYWFKQKDLKKSVREFWDRFQPLYAGSAVTEA